MNIPEYKKQTILGLEKEFAFLENFLENFFLFLKQEVGITIVETWFKTLKVTEWNSASKLLIFQVPNSFVKDWIIKNYYDLSVKIASRILNETTITIEFCIFEKNILMDSKIISSQVQKKIIKQESFFSKIIKLDSKSVQKSGILNKEYTFDSFIVGPSNELAYSACRSIADHICSIYNPLFIYGNSGLGKTHLLHSIGNYIKEYKKDIILVYQSSESFVQGFIKAIKSNTVDQFEESYSVVDVLLLDDIQVISKKEQTQEIFFKIFNLLYSMKKQIVVTSDCMPRDIYGLADRIKSRFEGGLVVDIYVPPFETMVAIVQKKAEFQKINLSPEIANYLASLSISSVREVEGLLLRLIAYSTFTKKPLTMSMVTDIVKKKDNSENIKDIDLSQVVALIFTSCKISLPVLRGSSRTKKIVYARHIASYLMKEYTSKSYREIANFLNKSDHTSIMYGHSRIKEQRKKDMDLNEVLCCIEAKLKKNYSTI